MPASVTTSATASERSARAVAARRAALRGSRADGGGRRLRDVLRSNVLSSVYPDGLLPSENELMLNHSAPRAVVREALSLLRDEGVVERVQGIGTFSVAERYIARIGELHGEHDGQSDRFFSAGRVRPEVLDRSIIPAPDGVARKLQIDVGEPVLRLEYVGHHDGEPIALATNYVAFPEADALADTPFTTDWYTLMRDAGVPLGGSEWQMSCLNADAAVASLLDVAPGAALMLGEELIWDASGRIYDFAVCYFRTDRFVFSSQAWSVSSRDGSVSLVEDNLPVHHG
jgi:GntR family transcriptional regulator